MQVAEDAASTGSAEGAASTVSQICAAGDGASEPERPGGAGEEEGDSQHIPPDPRTNAGKRPPRFNWRRNRLQRMKRRRTGETGKTEDIHCHTPDSNPARGTSTSASASSWSGSATRTPPEESEAGTPTATPLVTNPAAGAESKGKREDQGRPSPIRVAQLNLSRSDRITGELRTLVGQQQIGILLVQEPYIYTENGPLSEFYGLGCRPTVVVKQGVTPWAGIVVMDPHCRVLALDHLSTAHCACAEVLAPGLELVVISCYFKFGDDIKPHLSHLRGVLDKLRGRNILLGIDSNAETPLWAPTAHADEGGARHTRVKRGKELLRLIQQYDLEVLNDREGGPTYSTLKGDSHIDITLSTRALSRQIRNWEVQPKWVTGEHRPLTYQVYPAQNEADTGRLAPEDAPPVLRRARFNAKKADWERFDEMVMARLGPETDSGKMFLDTHLTSAASVEEASAELERVLLEICEETMPRLGVAKLENPWWTKELETRKREVVDLKRACQRRLKGLKRKGRKKQKQSVGYRRLHMAYMTAIRSYAQLCRESKGASWRETVTEKGNENPWGLIYKLQKGKLRTRHAPGAIKTADGGITEGGKDTAEQLLSHFVLDDHTTEDSAEQTRLRQDMDVPPEPTPVEEFTIAEVRKYASELKPDSAPGPDGIETRVIKALARSAAGLLANLFNGCLRWGVFPTIWKRANLVIIPKGNGKPPSDPGAYRPICLLPVLGKLFEKLLWARLRPIVASDINTSGRQYGFTRGRSTEMAASEVRRIVDSMEDRLVAAILIDIKDAFNAVWWPHALDSLKRRGCPAAIYAVLLSYFADRVVSVDYGPAKQDTVSKTATRGCPQGSVLGPSVWNCQFEDLLQEIKNLGGVGVVAYADDLVVIFGGKNRREIEQKGTAILEVVRKGCERMKLALSVAKTEGIFLRKGVTYRAAVTYRVKQKTYGRAAGRYGFKWRTDQKRKSNSARVGMNDKKRPPSIKLGTKNIPFKQTVRYLGIHYDTGMKVHSHCRYLATKVIPLFHKLARQARAHWGLRYPALQTIYKGVFVSVVTYAAGAWADLCLKGDLSQLRSLQRSVLLSISRAYSTTSHDALCVLTGCLPVELLLQKCVWTRELRAGRAIDAGGVVIMSGKEAEEQMNQQVLNIWQTAWDKSKDGRVTHAFFPNVRRRLAAKWVHPNHYVSQFLTGHGDFRCKLLRFNRGPADLGGLCDCGEPDTMEHVLLTCPMYEPQRSELSIQLDQWAWPYSAEDLVNSADIYLEFAWFAEDVLEARRAERAEREPLAPVQIVEDSASGEESDFAEEDGEVEEGNLGEQEDEAMEQ